MNIGGVLMLRFIGSLERSAEAQAAFTVGYNQLFSLITWSSVGLMGATAAVAGQNLGAGKPERVVSTVRSASGLGLALATAVGLAFIVIPHSLLAMFGISDAEVIRLGEELLGFLSLSGLLVTVALAHTGGLQGTGDTRSPLFITLISQLVVPLGFCAVIQAAAILQPVHVWIAILSGHFARATLSWARFRQGKWANIKLDVRHD
jgi:Na+-driven multidrug efflux pump